jgi:hypothetical protein
MRISIALVACLALAVGCSDDSITDPSAPMGLELTLTPAVDTIFLATDPGAPRTTTLNPSATVHGTAVPMPMHVFESADEAVATVDENGVVTAQSVGTTTVTVRVNDVRAVATIVVLDIVKSVTVTASASQVLVGDTIILTTALFDWSDQPVAGEPISFTSSSPDAIVTADGKVVFTAPGNATITATSDGATGTVTLTALARQFIGGGAATLSSGLDATCGLAPLGRTFCFGREPITGIARDTSCFGRTGEWDMGPAPCALAPLPIAASLSLAAVTVGDSVACGLTPAGAAYCWGDQTYGQIGNGISAPGTSTLPVAVGGGHVFTQISAGGTHACGITGGQAYCWGNDSTFQLGGRYSLRVNSSTPIPVGGSTPLSASAIAAGRKHTCALGPTGTAYCWGDNSFGQLGNGTVGGMVDAPTAVAGVPAFAQISARGDNTCGLTVAGTIYCWGANESGQTGRTAGAPVATPNLVAGAGYTFVSVGGRDTTATDGPMGHVCALAGTTATCWGANRYGQLGNGSTVDSSSPVTVPGTFTALSAGSRSTCAVAADGAYCWGSSIYGATGGQLQAIAIPDPRLTQPPQ